MRNAKIFIFFTLKIHSHRVFRTHKVAYPRNQYLFALSLWNQTERILAFAESKTGNRVRKASWDIESKSIISNFSKWKPPLNLSVLSLCSIKQSIQIYPIPFSRPGTVRIVVSPLTW